MYGNYVRPATDAEIADYNRVESAFALLDLDAICILAEKIGDYAFAYEPHERRRTYQRVYRIAKRYNVTVDALVNWYCID